MYVHVIVHTTLTISLSEIPATDLSLNKAYDCLLINHWALFDGLLLLSLSFCVQFFFQHVRSNVYYSTRCLCPSVKGNTVAWQLTHVFCFVK